MRLPASPPAGAHWRAGAAGQTRKREGTAKTARRIRLRARQRNTAASARSIGEEEMKKSKTASPIASTSGGAPLAPAEGPLAAPLLHTHLTLVETTEPELLEELLADRRIGPLLVARLSDCVAVVAPGHAKEVH